LINLKPTILQALESNPTLFSLLGGQRIYQMVAPNPDEYPRITFFEVTNFDSTFADDTALTSDILIQIDIWHRSSTSSIAKQVDHTMKQLHFKRTSATDLYEDDIQVFHKALRYVTTQMIEEE
jgi:hypothetical protein